MMLLKMVEKKLDFLKIWKIVKLFDNIVEDNKLKVLNQMI